jgi:hypothetical protein
MPNLFLISILTLITTLASIRDIQVFMLGVRLGVVGILAREDVKVLTVYVDLSVICVIMYLL